jgi:hypothetical protein
MLRCSLAAFAFAVALAAPAAANPISYDPSETKDDDAVELSGEHQPPSHHFSFRDKDENHGNRRHGHHGKPNDGGHDFHPDDDWRGHGKPDCTPVPEPTALALLGAATAFLITRRAKR